MGRARKYQVSVGLSSDLIDTIEKVIEERGYASRSQFFEEIIRENIFDRCGNCEIHRVLMDNGIVMRYEDMPKTLDEANEIIEAENEMRKIRIALRNRERMLMEIISTLQNKSTNQVKVANVLDVYTEAEKFKISRTKAEDIIEKLVRNGDIMRPSGYDSVQIV